MIDFKDALDIFNKNSGKLHIVECKGKKISDFLYGSQLFASRYGGCYAGHCKGSFLKAFEEGKTVILHGFDKSDSSFDIQNLVNLAAAKEGETYRVHSDLAGDITGTVGKGARMFILTSDSDARHLPQKLVTALGKDQVVVNWRETIPPSPMKP